MVLKTPHYVLVIATSVLLCKSTATAQSAPIDFSSADRSQKRTILLEIIAHEGTLTSAEIAVTIRAALADPDPAFRQGALAAVVSRAAAPRLAAPGSPAANNWGRDWKHVQGLRPHVVAALLDPVDKVRGQAVAALATLDFDIATQNVRIAAATERVLVERFYADESAAVRAKIVTGLGTDGSVDSVAVRTVIQDALQDSDPGVRHAATIGVAKFDPIDAIELLVNQLKDADHAVRGQAAIVLSRLAGSAEITSHLQEIEDALRRETDQKTRESLGRLLNVIKQPR